MAFGWVHHVEQDRQQEQQLQHQHDLERLQLSKDIESDKQAVELDHIIKTEQRKHENARMELVGVQGQGSG